MYEISYRGLALGSCPGNLKSVGRDAESVNDNPQNTLHYLANFVPSDRVSHDTVFFFLVGILKRKSFKSDSYYMRKYENQNSECFPDNYIKYVGKDVTHA